MISVAKPPTTQSSLFLTLSKAPQGSDILEKLENATECPPVVSVRSDVNDMRFVTFETETDCKNALMKIRNVKYDGKKLSARLKTASAKPVYTASSWAVAPVAVVPRVLPITVSPLWTAMRSSGVVL